MVDLPKAGGRFLGGILNNPGAVAIAGIGLAILVFRNDIRGFFGGIGQAFANLGNLQFPDISLPEITLPSVNVNLPETGSESLEERTFTREELGSNLPEDFAPGLDEIVVPELGRQDPRRPDPTAPDPTIEESFPNQPVSISDFIRRFTTADPDDLSPQQQQNIFDSIVNRDTFSNAQQQAVAIVGESQSDFQQRARDFVNELDQAGIAEEIVGSTSLPGAPLRLNEPQLSRNDAERFEPVLEQEENRADIIFQRLFGNVQNPDFPITLGEFIAGESGTVASPSLFGATDAQVEQFFAEQGL